MMTFFQIYLLGLAGIMVMMILLWLISIPIKNVSIVDIFWGLGFVLSASIFYVFADGNEVRKLLVLGLAGIWGIRLSIYLAWRNLGKGEDFRYQKFRQDYGPHRYWWVSFFQVFLLQGLLMWLVSAPLLGGQFYSNSDPGLPDAAGVLIWLIGFIFEAGGDFQLARFKSNPANRGKLLKTGLWRFTRHPNYFGDAAIWTGFGLISMGAGSYLPVLGSVIMIVLIIKVSGVAMLEKTLLQTKPDYMEYARKTSSFIPWFPKK